MDPVSPVAWLYIVGGKGGGRGWGESLAVRDKEDPVQKPCLSRAGAAFAVTYTGDKLEAAQTSVCSWLATDHAKSPLRPLLFHHCFLVGCWCWKRLEHTLKGNRASLDPTLRASAPATWDSPHP